MKNTPKPISVESLTFRKLPRNEKFNKLHDFCVNHNKTPSTSGVVESERVLGQFFLNHKTPTGYAKLNKVEKDVIDLAFTYSPKSKSRLEKLMGISEYCVSNNKIPSQTSTDVDEKDGGDGGVELKQALLLNSIKMSAHKKPFNKTEQEIVDIINSYKNNYQKSRKEKLVDLLEFCVDNQRTPKQHVADLNEKRMGEFLTTTRIANKNNKLDDECIELLAIIDSYGPLKASEKIDILRSYVLYNKKAPDYRSEIRQIKQLGVYFRKMKNKYLTRRLQPEIASKMEAILSIIDGGTNNTNDVNYNSFS